MSPKTTTTAISTATATWSIITSFTTGSSSNNSCTNSCQQAPISSVWQQRFTVVLLPPPVLLVQPSNAGLAHRVSERVQFYGTQFCLRLPAAVCRPFTKPRWRLQDICIRATVRRRQIPNERVQSFWLKFRFAPFFLIVANYFSTHSFSRDLRRVEFNAILFMMML